MSVTGASLAKLSLIAAFSLMKARRHNRIKYVPKSKSQARVNPLTMPAS